jgi:hypothetical protein
MTEKQSKISQSGKNGGARPGAGRPKGSVDKGNALIREMIVSALDSVGGVEYLAARANDPRTAGAFLSLVGKVMPVQVTGDPQNPLQHSFTISFKAPGGN